MGKLSQCFLVLLLGIACLSALGISDELDGPIHDADVFLGMTRGGDEQEAVQQAYTEAADAEAFAAVLQERADNTSIAMEQANRVSNDARDKANRDEVAAEKATSAVRTAKQWAAWADDKATKAAKNLADASNEAAKVQGVWEAKVEQAEHTLLDARKVVDEKYEAVDHAKIEAKQAKSFTAQQLEEVKKEEEQERQLTNQAKAKFTQSRIIAEEKAAGARKAAHAKHYAEQHKQDTAAYRKQQLAKQIRQVEDELVDAEEERLASAHGLAEANRTRSEDNQEALAAKTSADVLSGAASTDLEAAEQRMKDASTASKATATAVESAKSQEESEATALKEALGRTQDAARSHSDASAKVQAANELKKTASKLEAEVESQHSIEQEKVNSAEAFKAEEAEATAAREKAEKDVEITTEEVKSAKEALRDATDVAAHAKLGVVQAKKQGAGKSEGGTGQPYHAQKETYGGEEKRWCCKICGW
jgi:hypothetical protein